MYELWHALYENRNRSATVTVIHLHESIIQCYIFKSQPKEGQTKNIQNFCKMRTFFDQNRIKNKRFAVFGPTTVEW